MAAVLFVHSGMKLTAPHVAFAVSLTKLEGIYLEYAAQASMQPLKSGVKRLNSGFPSVSLLHWIVKDALLMS